MVKNNKLYNFETEAEYWDSKAKSVITAHMYEGIYTDLSSAVSLLGNIEGKVVLECGCGAGVATSILARNSTVYAFDISEEMIEKAKLITERLGVSHNIKFDIMDIYKLNYEDNSFDAVFGSFIIHHLKEKEKAGKEIARIMKPGSKGVFLENWALNPLLNFLRPLILKLSPQLRALSSPDEHPITYNELEDFCSAFKYHRVVFPSFYFFQLGYFLIDVFKILKPIHNSRFLIKTILKLLKFLDDCVYICLPFIRKYSYHAVIEVIK